MDSSNCRNQKLKITVITQNVQNRLIFTVVPQLRITDGSGFVKNTKVILRIEIIII